MKNPELGRVIGGVTAVTLIVVGTMMLIAFELNSRHAYFSSPAHACTPMPTYAPVPTWACQIWYMQSTNFINVTDHEIFVPYNSSLFTVGSYGFMPWAYDRDTVPGGFTAEDDTRTQTATQDPVVLEAGNYQLKYNFEDDNRMHSYDQQDKLPGSTTDETKNVITTVRVLDLNVTPAFDYLGVGKTISLSVAVVPGAPYRDIPTWYAGSKCRFIVGGQESVYAFGDSVTLKATETSNQANDAWFSVSQSIVGYDDFGRYVPVSKMVHFTAFRLDIQGGGDFLINWNDNGPENYRSDLRDSGKVSGEKTVCLTPDPNISNITISILPNISPLNTSTYSTNFTIEQGGDRIAVWDDNLRTNAEVTSKNYTNDQLPATLYLEPIRPHTLGASENYTDSTILKISCTIDDSSAEAEAHITNYIRPFMTVYTTPHECEYSGGTSTITVWNNSFTTSVEYTTYSAFVADAKIEGFGCLANPLEIDDHTYQYIDFTESDRYRGSDTDKVAASNHPPNNSSTAKCYLYGGALSAFNQNANIYIPKLKSDWLNYDSVDALTNRTIDDTGPGRQNHGKWLDIYVPYKEMDDPERINDFGQESWQGVLENILETNDTLKLYFQ